MAEPLASALISLKPKKGEGVSIRFYKASGLVMTLERPDWL